ncbi:DNA topoisomerase 1 [Ananas comosus]|uniref:DNA topoisomerase I n=1 Tax=Ananas comosus TaxID=4615 RepID=A0A199UPC3_ANACO|nr:DNA topoisomerase 1 [Ananas comosus]
MAVDGCVNPVIYDNGDDDDAPLTFKRSSSSRHSSLNSTSNKSTSQKRDISLQRARSDHSSPNGENSNLQKSKGTSTSKMPTERPKIPNPVSRSSVPGPPNHSSENKHTTSSMDKTNLKRPHENSDDSDDNIPLSQRANPASKMVKHFSEQRDTSHGKVEPSSDSDDDNKPLISKYSSVGAGKVPASSSKNRSGKESADDSEDKKPLASKVKANASTAGAEHVASSSARKINSSSKENADDSEDEKPLAFKFKANAATTGAGQVASSSSKKISSSSKANDSEDRKPLASKIKANMSIKKETGNESRSPKDINKRTLGDVNNRNDSLVKKAKVSDNSAFVKVKHESVVKKELKTDDGDRKPLAEKMRKLGSSDSKSSTTKVIKKTTPSSKKDGKKLKMKKAMKKSTFSKSLKVPPGSGGGQKWTTLEHNGVIFPPPYQPHGVKMLYNGQPVDLTPEQEEVATMFAVMKDTDYATKPKFIHNFFNDWRQVLGKNHVIKKFELCDFTPIYEWHLKEKEKKKQMSAAEKKALKEEKLKKEDKYMWAIVDGVKEKVGNFRVEPPALFRGRGEHPKMGKLKRRIRPSDITINIGKNAPIPECPIPGERWREVKHDNTVTWLAYWSDPINPKDSKYVFLAASSSLKGQSDKEKYEKARQLKDYIHNIRSTYTKDFNSKDPTKRQIAVATYLIDKLALRAGNEKDDDEADTVGCCTLKVENVICVPPNQLQFDFLGKDSIRYFNTVEVEAPVYKAIGEFRTARKGDGKRKGDGDDLFDLLDTSKLNAHLKELMPGLTAKVFRTYNASITLDDILNKETKEGTLPEKIAVYQRANKEVAIICNHQRSVSKSHESQMSRLNEKIDELKALREELKVDLSRARKGKPPLKDADGKTKRNLSPEAIQKKLAQTNAKIEKMELDKKIKEDLKTVALGTSKINYLDPRISVAWCKRHEVPIEKIFNKSLLAKFAWAMDVDPSYRF